ncbi:MAG: hypothetical protein WB629_00365, partial [Candidatus Sulfotelmatobacter sp.]
MFSHRTRRARASLARNLHTPFRAHPQSPVRLPEPDPLPWILEARSPNRSSTDGSTPGKAKTEATMDKVGKPFFLYGAEDKRVNSVFGKAYS